MKMPSLTIRKWLILAWLSYALLPGVGLGSAYGLVRLITARDIPQNSPLMAIVIAAGLCVQFSVLVAVGIFMGRAVLKPLSAMTQASRQIAQGDLDFSLPASTVREVAEVSTAFTTMRDGLRQAVNRQADLEQERRFFISAVAHDLRTPLFSLRGYLQGLERGIAGTPEKTAQYIAVCQEKADELEHLVADLFAYTQVEYLDQTPLREPVDLGDLLRQAADGLRPRAETKGLALVLDGPDESCRLEGDAHLLIRAATNLLDNALRHTPAGGTIRVSWRRDAERCVFSIADTGPGMDPHDLPHLFDPLYRAETSRNRLTGGAGLGLAITRRILQAHGGDITAANLPSGGAEFTCSVPLRSPSATTERTGQPASMAGSGSASVLSPAEALAGAQQESDDNASPTAAHRRRAQATSSASPASVD